MRDLQEQMMWPSDGAMKYYLKHNLIKGTDLTPKDIDNASTMLGRPSASIRGKTTVPSMVKNKS